MKGEPADLLDRQLREAGYQPQPGPPPALDGLARGRDLYQNTLELLIVRAPGADPWLFFPEDRRRPASSHPRAGIVPLDLASHNVISRSLSFSMIGRRFSFQPFTRGVSLADNTPLAPLLGPLVERLRTGFQEEYLRNLRHDLPGPVFFMPLLVTEAPLLFVHPEEAGNQEPRPEAAALAWEAEYLPVQAAPAAREQQAARHLFQEVIADPAITSWLARSEVREETLGRRLAFVLEHLPRIFWLVHRPSLSQALRFIASYARQWG